MARVAVFALERADRLGFGQRFDAVLPLPGQVQRAAELVEVQPPVAAQLDALGGGEQAGEDWVAVPATLQMFGPGPGVRIQQPVPLGAEAGGGEQAPEAAQFGAQQDRIAMHGESLGCQPSQAQRTPIDADHPMAGKTRGQKPGALTVAAAGIEQQRARAASQLGTEPRKHRLAVCVQGLLPGPGQMPDHHAGEAGVRAGLGTADGCRWRVHAR